MPSSQYYHISKLMEMIISLNPKSVLDIGSGFGKFGVLCREYLELWDGRQKYEFNRRIDGVEVFQQYISPLHRYVYDNIYNENILDIVQKLKIRYDLVLLIDVLEHFEKDQGKELVKTLLKKNGGIIISTPKKPSPQEDAFGNIYETHRSVWSKEELRELGFTFFIKDDISLICIISLEAQIISDFKKDLRILRKHSKTPSTIALKKILIKIPGVRRAYHGVISREN
jgi:2-polyprenyl-3-methyl-5-hydroxy-6-metoxy-1,4-benzoquinol methylase